MGALVKSYYAQKINVNPKDIYVVSVMPCTAKKYERLRPEMHTGGLRDIDAVLTTRELGAMLKEAGIDLAALPISGFDEPFGAGSGAGAIFGNTGGVMEAALRTVYEVVTGKPAARLEFDDIRGLAGVKETSIALDGITLNAAVIHGLGNVRGILDDIAAGTSPYHFIEIMCCPGGCIGGGGQPISRDAGVNEKRIQGLYREDESLPLRKSHDNPAVWELYSNYLGEPNSEKSHRLLHTHYHSRR